MTNLLALALRVGTFSSLQASMTEDA